MGAPEPRQIDWESATIKGASLTVDLTGESSKLWRAQFERVLALLGSSNASWGEISLTKDAIKVADIEPGSESDLRHFLESIVLEANADVAADSEADASDDADEPDRSMTATFRSFATED
jgi:hypothetical protein